MSHLQNWSGMLVEEQFILHSMDVKVDFCMYKLSFFIFFKHAILRGGIYFDCVWSALQNTYMVFYISIDNAWYKFTHWESSCCISLRESCMGELYTNKGIYAWKGSLVCCAIC